MSSVPGRDPETSHSDATHIERPVADRPAAPVAAVGSGSSVRSPIEALYVAEIAQVLMHRIGLAIAFASAAWTWWRVRDPNAFRPSTSTLFGSCCSLAVVSGLFYWGPYSAALVAVPIGHLGCAQPVRLRRQHRADAVSSAKRPLDEPGRKPSSPSLPPRACDGVGRITAGDLEVCK